MSCFMAELDCIWEYFGQKLPSEKLETAMSSKYASDMLKGSSLCDTGGEAAIC